MPVRSNSLVTAATFLAAAIACAGPVHAQGLKQVGSIAIPGGPINTFGVMYIDQATGLGYLADKDNKAVDIIDTKTDTYVGRIAGFTGTTSSGATSGPNGIIAINDELWVRAHSIGIGLAQNHVYLPTTAEDGPCGGCILVFAPQ
jgi:hypothetical protein